MSALHLEQLVVSLIVNQYKNLAKEPELSEFTEPRKAFDNNEDRIESVSLKRLHQLYPNYDLTKRLIDFTNLVVGYLSEYSTPLPRRGGGPSFGPSLIGDKLSLLTQNGVELLHLNQSVIN